jgi:DNA-binding NarL/FixJ family response regulator
MRYAPDNTRVLTITDDSFFYLRVHQACVRELGTEIMLTSNTTVKALKEITQLEPDIILVDGDLPDNDAISVCNDIIQNGYGGDIILFEMDFDRVKTAREIGVTTCLPQNISYRELLSSIRLIRQRDRALCDTYLKNLSLLYQKRVADDPKFCGNPYINFSVPKTQEKNNSVKARKSNSMLALVLPWLHEASVNVARSGVLQNIQRVFWKK